jgi:hypothetical protein
MTATSARSALNGSPPRPLWRRVAVAVAALPLSLRVVLLFAAALHGCGLSWGMPASDAWDNDGIAPRDILPGLAATFTPGEYFTYPPAHLALLAFLTLPVTLLAVVHAGTTAVPAVIEEILAPPYMTAMTMTARVVSLLMSLGIVVALAKIAEELAGRDAARRRRVASFTALFASVGAPFTYYAHTSNLDVPYLFWGSLAALALVRVIGRREPRRLRHAAAFAALAVATKDQAYALFVLAVPGVLTLWMLADSWARENVRRVAREAALGAALGVLLVLVLDGALVNPSGFRARLAFLSGPASQDYATYSRDALGALSNFVDTWRELRVHYPAPSAVFMVLGLVAVALSAREEGPSARPRRVAALVPLAIALSFTFAFNMVARRVEERFTLPHYLFASVYAGFGLELAFRRGRALGAVASSAVLAWAIWDAARVDLTLLLEPRYETEAFLAANAAGASVEVHGLNVYLPRFPPGARVVRVGKSAPEKRSPLPGVVEQKAPLSDIAARSPRFVVVSGCYAWRYLTEEPGTDSGRIPPPTHIREAGDADATSFFRNLYAGRLGYRFVHEGYLRPTGLFVPKLMHASLNCPTATFERENGP